MRPDRGLDGQGSQNKGLPQHFVRDSVLAGERSERGVLADGQVDVRERSAMLGRGRLHDGSGLHDVDVRTQVGHEGRIPVAVAPPG